MPLLFVVFIAVLVNFPSLVQAQDTNTEIRGPRSSDAPPAPQTIGPLSPSDTLWRLAERIKPEGNISLYQVMYALYLKNPDAFLDDNLNHLRPNAVLTLPSAEEIRQVDVAVARRKSEQDDKAWALRQKAASANAEPAVRKQPVEAAAQPEPVATQQWQAELSRFNEQQKQDLDGLRSQFADSMQRVESIAEENLQLKTSLAKVQQELELIRAQMGDDSAMQQQIELLLKQQAELLQAKAAGPEPTAETTDWQQWLTHPVAWVLAACIPALLVLFGILLWVKKRSQRTEQVLQAAATEPVINPAYHSPLPPLDNNDLDESLFEIDDALLEDAFNEPDELSELSAEPDDLLQFDDGLSFEDDSLLPPENDSSKASVTPLQMDDEFDPDNILSDTDLSALLAAADDDDAIELAEDNPVPVPDTQAAAAERIESIETMPEPDDFDIDDLIEEIDLDELADAEQLTPTLQEQQLTRALATAEPVQRDDIGDTVLPPTEALEHPEDETTAFDSSELDAFAESLAAEHTRADSVSDELDAADEALLNAELTELLDQVAEQPDPAAAADTEVDATLQTDGGSDTAGDDSDDVMLDEQDPEPAGPVTPAPDLTVSEDDSVVRPTDAVLSVENPSKMLEQYPELELAEEDMLAELDPELLLSELDALDGNATAEAEQPVELELDPMPEAQFDSLMSELEAMADNLDAAEQELEQQSDASLAQQLEAAQQSDNQFDFTDDDFVEIDTLLANATEQEQDSERFNQLNVDVGLDEYADIIGEHERRDVDIEDNGYSAKLDLVRAYIEMDDSESANLLLDEILLSDAPAHVKSEAQSLRQ